MLLFGALAGVGVEWFWTGRSIKNFKKNNAKSDRVRTIVDYDNSDNAYKSGW